ncbi:MAG: hypothetical protein ACI8XI_001299 [Woeseiaceae bacterium]|jgi:hypothetical protein|tara:strand:+ start:288 stop:1115 length:828 start_codon:yes stop_codon:yes gene_type:complete
MICKQKYLILAVLFSLFVSSAYAKEYKMESGNTFNLIGKYRSSEFITNNRDLKKISRETAGRATTVEGFLKGENIEVHFFNEAVGYVSPQTCNIDKDKLFEEIKKQTSNQSKETNRTIKPLNWVVDPVVDNELHAVYYAFNAQFDNSGKTWTNFRIYELGRGGYEQMLIVATPDAFKTVNPQELVEYFDANHYFPEGQRYEDYQIGDPLAPIGDCGLVGSFSGALEDEDLGLDEVEDEVDDESSNNLTWLIALLLALVIGGIIAFNRSRKNVFTE